MMLSSLSQRMFARASRQRVRKVLAEDIKKSESIEAYFDKLMRRRPESARGSINLPRRNFEDILRHHVHTADDYNQMLDVFYNYVGHMNTFPQKSTDELLEKALKLREPELAYDLIGNHAELLIHPKASIMRSFFKQANKGEDYEKLKSFFEVTKGRFFLQRPQFLNKTVIERAYEAGDKETVISAYLDILDYEEELAGVDETFFAKVLESMSYEEAIDHVLFGHVKEQMEKRGFECRIYSCVYYLNANGGLTASDILKEMAADASVTVLPASELFKTEFVEKVLPPEDSEDSNPLQLDAMVLEQVQLALKQLKGKLDTGFYESAAAYLGDAPKQAEESQEDLTPEATEEGEQAE